MGLVNTYDRIKVLDAHYRAIARAAPICYAFGFNLALFDFPFNMEPDEMVDYVTDKTTIGESGKYLRLLHEGRRFYLSDLPKKGFQAHLGNPVVTTSKPEEKFRTTPQQLVDEIIRKRSFLILVGLGRKGLPKNMYQQSRYHLDITSCGVSLETCTAIGAIAANLEGIAAGRGSSLSPDRTGPEKN